MNKFADLHCHPHMRSFNWLRDSKIEKKKPEKFHPWHVIASKIKSKDKGIRANAYSQCDLIKLKNGHMKLAFVALYPMEKGWFMGCDEIPPTTYQRAIKSITNNYMLRKLANQNYAGIEKFLLKLGKGKGSKFAFRDIVQSVFLKLPDRRVQFLQDKDYSYFDEMLRERDFLKTKNNIQTDSEIFMPAFKNIFKNKKRLIRKNKNEFKAEGTYEIVKGKNDLTRINDDEERMAFVFTIEGSNVFNTEDSIDEIENKIQRIKNWKDTPVFFISLAHHFNNYLCGHAHSIPDYGGLVMDQTTGMNEGFSEKGKTIIRYFLNLDESNKLQQNGDRRILIDTKHMSAASRKYYYDEIVKPCREKGDHIPIIASHVAYSGVKTLDDLIRNASNETDTDSVSSIEKPFNTWNINLSDEDILEVFKSEGIIGLNLDQRILAMGKKEKKKAYPDDYDIGFLWENLKAMMLVIYNSDLPNKKNLVNLFGLGTDFDGYIDPLDNYPTVLEFDAMKNALIDKIKEDKKSDELLYGISPEDFADKFCYTNAYEFVLKHFKNSEDLLA